MSGRPAPDPASHAPAPGAPALAAPGRWVLDAGARYRLSVYGVGLACCAVEVVVATVRQAQERVGPRPPALAGEVEEVVEVEVMVVAGTVTDRMAPALLTLYEAMPRPRAVLSFGACANSGGPYWDSYSVTKGVDQLLPVDVYVPGCPPRPEALLDGLRALAAGRGLAAADTGTTAADTDTDTDIAAAAAATDTDTATATAVAAADQT